MKGSFSLDSVSSCLSSGTLWPAAKLEAFLLDPVLLLPARSPPLTALDRVSGCS